MANVEFSGFDEVEAALKGVRDGIDELNDELMNDGADYANRKSNGPYISMANIVPALCYALSKIKRQG